MPLTLAEAASTDLELLGVLAAIVVLLVGAYLLHVPYPILLVVGGAALGFAPGLPDTRLEPDLVLVIFLPPLLYASAFFSSLRDLRDNLRPITLLSVGCVLATVLGVAVVAHAVVDGMNWPVAFVLGAILSPTDAIAASAIAGRVGAPQRFQVVIEGESLVNDATALIAYKFAVAAAVTGSFALGSAVLSFVGNAAAGIGIGLAVGYALVRLRGAIEDPPTEIALSLVTPFLAYLPAEALHVSAVLAAVSAGIILGWNSPWIISPETRLQTTAVWGVIQFTLNASLFTLVGLQLPAVLDGVSGSYGTMQLVGYGLAVCAAVVAVRFLWVFPATYLPRVSRRIREHDPYPNWRQPLLVAYSGMRGGVSLATALALPLTVHGGKAFPQRDLLVFLTFCAIFATLVVQGGTLPLIIRRLGLREEIGGGTQSEREAKARIKASKAALARLDQLREEDWTREQSVDRMVQMYEFRVRRFRARFDPDDDGDIDTGSLAFQRMRREALEAERAEIIRMRNAGQINDDVMHRIERDLDLEDLRLEI